MSIRCAIGLLLLTASIGAARLVRAEGLNLFLQPRYVHTQTAATDQSGATTHHTRGQAMQRYRLSLEHTIFPYLRYSGGALFDQINSGISADDTRGSVTRNDQLFSHLTLGGPVLKGRAGYLRRGALTTPTPGTQLRLLSETYSLQGTWEQLDLPRLHVKAERRLDWDPNGQLRSRDTVNDVLLASATYDARDDLDLAYAYRYEHPQNRITQTQTISHTHSLRSALTKRLFADRTRLSASYAFAHRTTRVLTSSSSGQIIVQQHPVAGLSLKQEFGAVAELSSLQEDATLVDGATDIPTRTNIGHSQNQDGLALPIELGIQFVEPFPQVSKLYVWLDRDIADVLPSFEWVVYQSEDNETWHRLPQTEPPRAGDLDRRVEISIGPTASRYIKVVTTPLAASASLEERFSDIFVTELQSWLVGSADQVQHGRAIATSRINATARTRLLDEHDLFYDLSINLAQTHLPSAATTYYLSNGVSYARRLGAKVRLTLRGARRDTDSGHGHEGAFEWGGALVANPLTTLMNSVVYSGRLRETYRGDTSTHSLFLMNRATLYAGISVSARLGLIAGRDEANNPVLGRQATLSTSLAPHKKLTLNGFFSHTAASRILVAEHGEQTPIDTRGHLITASASYRPVPNLYLMGGVSRRVNSREPSRTLMNYGVGFSPFPDGTLQINVSYDEFLIPDAENTSRRFTPSLRWNIRTGAYLDVSYAVIDTAWALGRNDSKALNSMLTLSL